jgi:hypothetical protein
MSRVTSTSKAAAHVVHVLRQPQGKLGCRLSGNNTVSEVQVGSVAAAAGIRVGWLVKSINGEPTASHDGAAVDTLALLIKQNVFRFVIEVDTEPPPPSAKKSAAAGSKRKLTPERKAPPEEKAAPEAKIPKPKAPSKPTPHPLAAEHEVKRQKLLAKQSKQLADLKAKQAAELVAFEATCKKEQVNASGKSECAYCGTKVAGVVEKPKYSFQSLPNGIAETTCCFCQLTRKCKACKWTVSCAYEPDEHGFCDGCADEANICWDCDGGCRKCQDNNGCCSTNGGRPR